MTAISEFAARQNAHNDKLEAAIAGVQADVTALNDLIEQLQGTPGKITAEDQKLLDQLEARGAAMAEKMAALDELTPPTVPPVGPIEPGAPAPVAATAPVPNDNVLPPNPDQTSSQLRGSGAPVMAPQDPNRAPNPPTNPVPAPKAPIA